MLYHLTDFSFRCRSDEKKKCFTGKCWGGFKLIVNRGINLLGKRRGLEGKDPFWGREGLDWWRNNCSGGEITDSNGEIEDSKAVM